MENKVNIMQPQNTPRPPVPKPPVKRNFMQRFILSFSIIVISLAINILVYFILMWGFDVNYLFSNAWAWLVYVIFLYITRKYFYYRDTAHGFKAKWREFYRFIGIRFATGVLDMIMMFVLVGLFLAHPMNAKFIVILIVTVLNIILANFWIFRKPKETGKTVKT